MKPLKIIFIDDEQDLLEIFSETFSGPGRQIEIFSDPELALEFIRCTPPDLIFIDYRLPHITGDQLALKMNNNIPKVLVSGDLIFNEFNVFVAKFPKPLPINLIQNFIRQFEEN